MLRSIALALTLILSPVAASRAAEPDRTILPVAPPEFGGKIGETYKESTPAGARSCPCRRRPARPIS